MERIVASFKEWGPYLALELVMPGGTMMALLLYLHRRRTIRQRLTNLSTNRSEGGVA